MANDAPNPVVEWMSITQEIRPKPLDVLRQEITNTLQGFQLIDFGGLAGNAFGPDFIPMNHTEEECRYQLLKQAEMVIHNSHNSSHILKANLRNRTLALVGKAPIYAGDCLHGLKTKFLSNVMHGVLAGDFFGGRGSGNAMPMCLLLAEMRSDYDYKDKTLAQIINDSDSENYGLGKDNVTLVLAGNGEYKRSLPKFPSRSVLKPASLTKALPVGASATEITACIVNDESQLLQVINFFKKFPFYIRVFNGKGELVLSPKDYDQARKK